jgi:hypothetical protein
MGVSDVLIGFGEGFIKGKSPERIGPSAEKE